MSERVSPALTAVVEAHYDELKAFILRKVGDPALAADIVQETWLRAAVRVLTQPVHNARAYLYRVASNLAIDYLRQEQARSKHVAFGSIPEEVLSSEPAPDQMVQGQEEFLILREAVRALPEKCRLVFLLAKGHGLSMREIAETLEISEKTVEKHIAKAMVHCRTRLREAGRHV